MAVVDQGPIPAPPLPTTPPVFQGAKAPGGGLTYPTWLYPDTGNIYAATGATQDPNTGSALPEDQLPAEFRLSSEQQQQINDWMAAVAAANASLANQSSSKGTAPVTGEGTNVPDTTSPNIPNLPGVAGPPPPPQRPQSIEGYRPTNRGMSDAGFGGDQSFASLIPRVAGNSGGPRSPGDISGSAPNIPAWARGLMRSPYARALGRTGQNSFSSIGGFQPEAPMDDQVRRQQALAALGLPPVA